MGYTSLTLGLTLTIPTSGTKNWGATMLSSTWTRISQHGHTGGGDGNQIATGALANNAVTSAKLSKNIALFQKAATLSPAGNTQTVDWNNGNIQKVDVGAASGNVTLTLSNPSTGGLYTVYFQQGATPYNLIWPAGVLWPSGQAPLLSLGDNQIDRIELYYDGTNYFGRWENNFS